MSPVGRCGLAPLPGLALAWLPGTVSASCQCVHLQRDRGPPPPPARPDRGGVGSAGPGPSAIGAFTVSVRLSSLAWLPWAQGLPACSCPCHSRHSPPGPLVGAWLSLPARWLRVFALSALRLHPLPVFQGRTHKPRRKEVGGCGGRSRPPIPGWVSLPLAGHPGLWLGPCRCDGVTAASQATPLLPPPSPPLAPGPCSSGQGGPGTESLEPHSPGFSQRWPLVSPLLCQTGPWPSSFRTGRPRLRG